MPDKKRDQVSLGNEKIDVQVTEKKGGDLKREDIMNVANMALNEFNKRASHTVIEGDGKFTPKVDVDFGPTSGKDPVLKHFNRSANVEITDLDGSKRSGEVTILSRENPKNAIGPAVPLSFGPK